MTLDYSGACIAQKPIYPHICELGEYDIQTLSEYVMTYYVESLKVLCLQIFMFFITKMYEIFLC